MSKIIIKNGQLINEGRCFHADVLIEDNRIANIGGIIEKIGAKEIDAEGMWVIPGIIDDQVHFREPGLTHKANIYTESRAAAKGGVTSYMEMPNTKPPAINNEELEKKYVIAQEFSHVNYSFYLGATNDNIEEVKAVNKHKVCGVKIFMGSSTGNMLVDNHQALRNIFRASPCLIATHCEDEATIMSNLQKAVKIYGSNIPFNQHPTIRDELACYKSSSFAVDLAKEFKSRLHILHISTSDEVSLFSNIIPLKEKKITSEVCVHHLFFTSDDYAHLGSKIKCNPAVKSSNNRDALWDGLLDNHLDIVATDHAPHTAKEKSNPYATCPSGIPLIEHGLIMMLASSQRGKISIEKIVEKMCHAPALCFQIKDRGYLREGYFADLVIINPDHKWTVDKSNIAYKCRWSPLENISFKGMVYHTFVNGSEVYNYTVDQLDVGRGQRLLFDRV